MLAALAKRLPSQDDWRRQFTVRAADIAYTLESAELIFVMSSANAVIFAAIAAQSQPLSATFAWLVGTLAIFGAILASSRRARRRAPRGDVVSARGRRRLAMLSLLQAAPWCVVAYAWMRTSEPQFELVAPIVCAGMAASGAMMTHRLTGAALVYCLAIVGSMAVAALLKNAAMLWPIAAYAASLGVIVSASVVASARAMRDRDRVVAALSTKNAQLRDAKEEIGRLVFEDAVTGLPNRKALLGHLEARIAGDAAAGAPFAFLMLDLDRFKNLNDSLGHLAGDRLLARVADCLRGALQPGDVVARLGGDEFAAVIGELGPRRAAVDVAQAIRAAIAEPVRLQNTQIHPDVSIGVSLYPDHGATAIELMMRADIALHHAKDAGKGRIALYVADMATAISEADIIERDLRADLAARRLRIFYQPKVDIATRRIASVEALLRWPRRDGGFTSPATLLDVAEQRGMILDLTKYIFEEITRDFAAFYAQHPSPPPVAINVHPTDLKNPGALFERVDALLASGVSPRHVILEITEGCIVGRGSDGAALALDQLAETGIALSLDDFGTGHASLSHLRSLPVSEIKIDRSFIRGLCDDRSDRAIVCASIAIAKQMRLRSVAEGVETEAQLSALGEIGCDVAQGYLFSPAVSRDAYLALLRAEHPFAPPPQASAAAG